MCKLERVEMRVSANNVDRSGVRLIRIIKSWRVGRFWDEGLELKVKRGVMQTSG